jgi:hypothetical protein
MPCGVDWLYFRVAAWCAQESAEFRLRRFFRSQIKGGSPAICAIMPTGGARLAPERSSLRTGCPADHAAERAEALLAKPIAPVSQETVLGWFKEAWPDGASSPNGERWWPDEQQCRIIAYHTTARRQLHPRPKAPEPEAKLEAKIEDARRAAKVLLKALDKDAEVMLRASAEISLGIKDMFIIPIDENPWMPTLKAECEIDSLLRTLKRLVVVWTPEKGSHSQVFYKRALQAWKGDREAVPKGVNVNTNEGSPMNLFIELALNAAGKSRSRSAIDKDVHPRGKEKASILDRNNKQKK